jgi:hypothetical protein
MYTHTYIHTHTRSGNTPHVWVARVSNALNKTRDTYIHAYTHTQWQYASRLGGASFKCFKQDEGGLEGNDSLNTYIHIHTYIHTQWQYASARVSNASSKMMDTHTHTHIYIHTQWQYASRLGGARFKCFKQDEGGLEGNGSLNAVYLKSIDGVHARGPAMNRSMYTGWMVQAVLAQLDLSYDASRFFYMHVDSTLLCAARYVVVCMCVFIGACMLIV